MTENELIRLFLPIINAGLVADGFSGVTVKQSNQPTLQGANTNPTVYFYKLFDKRYGFLRRDSAWNASTQVMTHTETQMYETSFQVGAMVSQDPNTPDQYTASDLVNEVSAIMQSDATRGTLVASNVGILRVTEVRNPYFQDDHDKFEAFPSFDFTLTHRQTRVGTDPVVESVEFGIYRV
jgi:E217 gateway protein gp29